MSPHLASPAGAPRKVIAVILSVLACLSLGAIPAAAQPPADQRALLSLLVNLAPQGDALVILRPGDALVEVAALDRAHLTNYTGRRETIEGRVFVSLASLAPDITFEVDEPALSLKVTATAAHLGSAAFDLTIPRPRTRYARTSSGFLNYGVNWTRQTRADGSIEAGLSVGPAMAQNTMSWDPNHGFVRGLSNVTVDQREILRRWTIGDSLVGAQGLGSGMLLGGVRVAREYGLDPYFVQFPTLGLSGTTLTPSTVDVYVNGNLVSRQQVAPGTFTLNNVPMPNGSNETRVVVRDAFGREQQMAAPFYLTTAGLAKGLQDYDYAVGYPRASGAAENWNYGRLSAIARHRYGFTDTVTAGFVAEADTTGVSAGPTMNVRLRGGELELSASASRMDARTGAAVSAGVAHSGRALSLSARVRSMSADYSSLMVRRPEDRMKFEAAGLVGFQLMSRVSLSLQQSVSETHAHTTASRSSLIGSVRVVRTLNLFVNVSHAVESGTSHTSIYAGAGVALGALTSASVWGQSGGVGSGASAEVQRSLPVGNGIGYRARAALGGTSQAEGTVEAQSSYGRYEAGQEVIDGQSSTHVNASGGVVFIGGGVHPTRPVNQSYALVRVPDVSGVRAYLNNQEIGRTNRKGDTLISNLLPYYANRIAISDQDVPLDHDLDTVEQAIAPPYRGGALVVFRANRRQAITGTVAVTIGTQTVIPALGELIVTVGKESFSSPIGANGEFYLENIPAGRYQAIVVYKGGRCRMTVEVPTSTAPIIRLGIIRCGAPDADQAERHTMTTITIRRGSRTPGWLLAACVAVALLAGAGAARAACTVSLTSNVAFGTYNVFNASPLDSTGQFTWRCDILTFPYVRITLTRGGSTTYLPRRMHSGAALLDYNLYLDAARTRIWGDESEGTQAYYQQFWGFGSISVSIYGRVPASQDASVGTYSDSVTLVVNF